MYGTDVNLSEGISRQSTAPAGSARSGFSIIKRAMDVCLASAVLIVAAPAMLLIGLLIRLTSRGPAIFKQTRIGLNGRPFTVYKFRTMYQDADFRVHRDHILAFVQGRVEAAPGGVGRQSAAYKLVQDARVTRLGRFLRRSSLDELPQLLNVLKGDMSLVGPRPDVSYSVDQYQEWHKLRLTVRPGITGLWQVTGRGSVSFEEMMRLDCEYVLHQSPWLDLSILIRTIPAVLTMQGAA
jgi:lipopolysaccharide/colanic/teichoic acid biosynthesis glycosyltransferase